MIRMLLEDMLGELGYTVAAEAAPFVFATGYGELADPYRDRPTLKKPFQMDGLKQMLQSALDRGSQ
jgi:hypothetical protein